MVNINLAAALADHDEDQLLNGIWIGLLAVEALMVFGVAVRGLVGMMAPRMKQGRSSIH